MCERDLQNYRIAGAEARVCCPTRHNQGLISGTVVPLCVIRTYPHFGRRVVDCSAGKRDTAGITKDLRMRTRRLAPVLILFCAISLAGTQVPNDPGEPGVITGTVIDSEGHPLAHARVYVREHNMPQTGAVRYVTTDQDGQFRLGNLRPGDYDVFAVPPNSMSMLSHWKQQVHLPKDKPIGNVTIHVGSSAKTKS